VSAAAVPYLQRGPGRADDGRRGKVFSIRIGDEDRAALAALARKAETEMPWSYERRRGSIGGFLVWAALQWKAPSEKIARGFVAGAPPPKRRRKPSSRRVVPRPSRAKVVPRRRRRGTTAGKKGGRK
jgi:hypothetical protein